MVNMGEIFAHDRICGIPMDRVPLTEKEKEVNLLNIGDLLFARQSLVLEGAGKCSIFLGDDEDVCFESHIIRCRLDAELCDPRYYFYLFQCKLGRDLIWTITEQGAGASGIRGSDLAKLELPRPNIGIQRKIADTLDFFSDKIALNQQMNETLEGIARAIFKDWFVDFGPVRAKERGEHPIGPDGEPMSDDLLALFPDRLNPDTGLPEGWAEQPFSDFVDLRRETVQPGAVEAHDPYIGLEHMPRQSIALHEWEGADKVTSNKSRFYIGDILFGKLRPYFHKVGRAVVDGICSTDIMVFAPKAEQYAEFSLICASNADFVTHANQASTGTRMPRANWQNVSEFQITCGSEELVNAYSNLTTGTITKIAANIAENKTLAKLRDTLLPKLMSGKVSVDEIREIA
ncbi:hypothetical protein GCM10017044_04950 [Kordiimonas sediminis]|uniref:Type I restriction modification DNA specificity domain-containing protein n=2 Tax=Kordiimonas sediminis TaxID=1735581 RepID=A0A919AL24_9PROT|nr:hypothetical protein GCM10017044_04950 [Kordiimonas sediminis]